MNYNICELEKKGFYDLFITYNIPIVYK